MMRDRVEEDRMNGTAVRREGGISKKGNVVQNEECSVTSM
jgi:hypothetical protein